MKRWLALSTAALVGFMSLSYEILWYRAFSFTTAGSPTVFGALLFAFLLGIAVGALAVRRFFRPQVRVGDPGLIATLGLMLAIANILGFLVVPILAMMVHRAHWGLGLPLIIPATAAWGAALPLLSHYRVEPDRHAGAGISYIYLANILGSSAGALLTGLVFTDHLGLSQLSTLFLLAGESHALLLLLYASRSRRTLIAAASVVTGLAMLVAARPAFFDQLYERLQYRRAWKSNVRFTNVVENRSGVISVTPEKEVFGGGAYDGVISTSLMDDRNLIVRAYALPAIHPRPRQVLMIGLSTGAWAQVIAHIPTVEHLTVVEINPGYLQLIANYPEVASLLHNPKVSIVIDDGRRWMARNPDRKFDAIVANTTFHWRSHATNLLSAEYLELARARLRPGGVLHYNTTNSDDALKTGLAAFPFGMRMLNFATVSESPVRWDGTRLRSVLEGLRIDGVPVFDPSNPEQMREVNRIIALGDDMTSAKRYGLESREHVLQRLSGADIVTDDNMITEWRRAAIFRVFPGLAP